MLYRIYRFVLKLFIYWFLLFECFLQRNRCLLWFQLVQRISLAMLKIFPRAVLRFQRRYSYSRAALQSRSSQDPICSRALFIASDWLLRPKTLLFPPILCAQNRLSWGNRQWIIFRYVQVGYLSSTIQFLRSCLSARRLDCSRRTEI